MLFRFAKCNTLNTKNHAHAFTRIHIVNKKFTITTDAYFRM